MDKCHMYGRNWSCPPACGTTREMRETIACYRWGMLLQTTGYTEDSFDFEAMQKTEERHKSLLFKLNDSIVDDEDHLLLGAGACTLCSECSYPEEPCRHPKKMMSSMEAYGLMVSDVCSLAGLPYSYGERSVTYTGCLLFR